MTHRIAAPVVLMAMVMVVVAGSGAAAAQAVEETTVQVMRGPTAEATFAPECNDVGIVFDEATSFVLERTGEVDEALTVAYEVDGSAVAGEHYEALPGAVAFGAGEARATVATEVLTGERSDLVELQLRIVDGSDYQPGVPDAATIRFVRPRDPSLPPPECGFFFAEGDRIERTVETGSIPERLVVEQIRPPIQIEVPPEGYRMTQTGGTLPPGLSLAEDGRFVGAAEEVGTYESTIEACRTEPPGTCITTTLVVTVEGATTTSTTTRSTTTSPTGSTATTSMPSSGERATTPSSTRRTLPATGASSTPVVSLGTVLIGLGLALWGASTLRLSATAPGRAVGSGARPGRRWPPRRATSGRGRRAPGPRGRRARWRGPRGR